MDLHNPPEPNQELSTTLPFLVDIEGSETAQPKGLFHQAVPQTVEIPVHRLAAQIEQLKHGLKELFASFDDLDAYHLDEVGLTLDVNAEGSVSFIGSLTLGTTGGISLTFRRHSGSSNQAQPDEL